MEEVELCFPELFNLSCRKVKRFESESVFISFILYVISLITGTLNLLVIISISHFRQLHTPTNLLLLSLAVSDFFVSIVLLFQIMFIDGCWYLGDLMCVFYYVLDITITSTSLGNMVLISVDRYVAICDPLHYPTRITMKTVQISISLCWIFAFIYNIVILNENLKQPGGFNSCIGECVLYASFTKQVADFFVTFIIPITVIIVLYLRVFVVAVSQVQAMRSHVAAAAQKQSVTVKKSEIKAAGTLGVVVVVFLICFFPYYGVILADQDSLMNTLSSAFVICLFYLNFSLNPLIYAFFYPWFRKSVKFIVTFEILKSGSRDANLLYRNTKKKELNFCISRDMKNEQKLISD